VGPRCVVRAFGWAVDFIGDWFRPSAGMDTQKLATQALAAELFSKLLPALFALSTAEMADILGRVTSQDLPG